MNIQDLNDTFSDRFTITRASVEGVIKYILYLDGKILGKQYLKHYGYNTVIDKEEMLTVYCDISELDSLHLSEIPNNIDFSFIDLIHSYLPDDSTFIHPEFRLANMKRENNNLLFEFWFNLNIVEYQGDKNPIKLVDDYYSYLLTLNHIICDYNDFESELKLVGFKYCVNIENKITNIKSIKEMIIKEVLFSYEKSIRNDIDNTFESKFNFPKEYQSILKPYLLYFEEFLHDLCIETDVNIQVVGEETILSVVPKDKDEALDKIADALKAYLCAPIMSNGVSMEQSLQMQTTLTKLYSQCKHLESQMMLKELTLKEQNKQIELKDNIINESKRVLIDSGVESNIITQNNTLFLESLKSLRIDGREVEKKPFISSIKGSLKCIGLFSTSLEIDRK